MASTPDPTPTPEFLDAIEDALEDGPDPEIGGHLFRGMTVAAADGTAVDDVWLPCTRVAGFDPAALQRYDAEGRIDPPLSACGRHEVHGV
jgi:hypothetical protein